MIARHEGKEKDLEWSFDVTQRFYRRDLPHKLRWLRLKSGVTNIAIKLQCLQTRRIAVEVTEGHFMLADVMGVVRDLDDGLTAIERRLQMSKIG